MPRIAFGVCLALLLGCAYDAPPTAPSIVPPVIMDTPTPSPPQPAPVPFGLLLIVGPSDPQVGTRAAFTALATMAQPADPATYNWTFGDGATDTTTTSNTQHTYRRSGTYTSRVSVTDSDGRQASADHIVSVRSIPPTPPPSPPQPPSGFGATLTCTARTAGSDTPCNITVSYNDVTLPSANVIGVDWDWGDGNTDDATGPAMAHLYALAGTYTIFATVTANTKDGAKQATKSVTIKVL